MKKTINAREYAEVGYIHPDHAAQVIKYYKNSYHDWYGSPHKEEDGVVDPTAKHYVTSQLADGGNSIKFTHASGINKGKTWKLKIGFLPENVIARDYMQTRMNENFVAESEGNFPPARLIGAGMKAAKKKHGVDANMPYKELKSKHPEVAKTGWRIAHVFWRKEKNAAKEASKSKKKVSKQTVQEDANALMKRFFWGPVKKKPERKQKTKPSTVSGGKPPEEKPPIGKQNRNPVKIHENKALNFQQRLARARQFRRIEPRVQRGQLRYQDRAPNQQRLERRAERMARNMIKMRISHTPYDQMSIPEKIMIDRILEKKQKAIKKLAQRLLPKVRKLSTDRLSRPTQYNSTDYNDKISIIENKIQNLEEAHYKSSLQTITDILSGNDSPAIESLKNKASLAGVSFDQIVSVYAEAIEKYNPENSKITSEQYAFNAVNIFVKEQVNMIAEGLFGSMFIPPTTRFMAALSTGPRGFGPSPHAMHKPVDRIDQAKRSKASHSFAKEKFKETSRGSYKSNAKFGTASHRASMDAERANSLHSDMMQSKHLPKQEYSVGNREFAIKQYAEKKGLHPHDAKQIVDFDKHYHSIKEETIEENMFIQDPNLDPFNPENIGNALEYARTKSKAVDVTMRGALKTVGAMKERIKKIRGRNPNAG